MWCYERRVRRETLVYIEDGHLFPTAAIEEQLGDIYEATLFHHLNFCGFSPSKVVLESTMVVKPMETVSLHLHNIVGPV